MAMGPDGTRTQDWMFWRGPSAIPDRLIQIILISDTNMIQKYK
jgi:hypothetical protein